MNYGERFRVIRKTRFRGTVLSLAKRLGSEYPATIYNIERDWRVPTLPTLAKHAAALQCEPWELLEQVDAEVDRVRALAQLPKAQADKEWAALLKRYEHSTRRGGAKEGAAELVRLAEREVGRLMSNQKGKKRGGR
jgi:transcriptional regulator with XRE-family HTH domain